MRKRIMTRALTPILVIGVSLLLVTCESRGEREAARGEPTKGVVAPDGAIHVTPEQRQMNDIHTAPVLRRDMAAAITAIGRVQARAGGEVEIFSPFAGRLIADPATLPHVGSVVREGQVVAEVEQALPVAEQVQFEATAAQMRASVEQAQQEVDLRRTELTRAQHLYDARAIALKEVQTVTFNLKQAQARLAGATRAKARYEALIAQGGGGPRRVAMRAPITGVVAAAHLIPGQQIDPATHLLTIVDVRWVWIDVALHESDLPAVSHAARAELTTPAYPGRTYSGELVTIGSVVDPTSRTLPVLFAVDNADGSLKIGMTAAVHIRIGPSQPTLLIPSAAVLYSAGQPFVYVEREPGVYTRRGVTLGERRDEALVITAGLHAGEQVVAVGAQSLYSETLKGYLHLESDEERR